MRIIYNGTEYEATYNKQSGYYEIELQAPQQGGVYPTQITYTDLLGDDYQDIVNIQVFAKEQPKLDLEKNFMWIFDYKDFSVKDIAEIADYELNIDEETNANSIIKVLKHTTAKTRDIIAFKKNNEVVYWGTIQEVQNDDGENVYQYITKYITNIFDRKILLENQDLIKTTGVEDFIADAITRNYIQNSDTFINLNWLELDVRTHTTKQTSVTNIENGIYNLHTWITNCTQNYDIVYSFNIVNNKLVMTIEAVNLEKELIDTQAQPISNYLEVFETDVVSKVVVKYDKKNDTENPGTYTLYLKTDRTTTENQNDPDRADGKVETVFIEDYEDARQTALDTMKSNSYNHNITFSYLNRLIKVGTPIAIKTKKSLIFDTYISAIKVTQSKFIEYTCGNIRINFIDKLLKERRN